MEGVNVIYSGTCNVSIKDTYTISPSILCEFWDRHSEKACCKEYSS